MRTNTRKNNPHPADTTPASPQSTETPDNAGMSPARSMAFGYVIYTLIGTFALALPICTRKSVQLIDHFFIAASAVSSTGLVTVDPGTTYNLLGQIILLLLIQMSGIGYMTMSSFLLVATKHHLSKDREHALRTSFVLPNNMDLKQFIINVIRFTLVAETLGSLALYKAFLDLKVEHPLWSAIFHSVSAFCEAGFSLFPDNLVSLQGNFTVNTIIIILSLLGGVGFIVLTDVWDKVFRVRKQITFTTKVILSVLAVNLALGTITFFLLYPGFDDFSNPGQRFMVSLFQTVAASTTSGFNTVAIDMPASLLMIMCWLMICGASPAGTGGGIRSTTVSALYALVSSTLLGRKKISVLGHEVPEHRLRAATVTTIVYTVVIGTGAFLLGVSSPNASLASILFETSSALGNVGLSMGFTEQAGFASKLILITTMIIGRIGVVTFGLSLVPSTAGDKEVVRQADLAV